MSSSSKNVTSSTTVVLFSYMRPELTAIAIRNLLNWPKLSRLIVSIDGLRESAHENEITWRNETIEVSRMFASQHKDIEVIVWEENNGLTAHAIRIFNHVFQDSNNVISTEEDVDISREGLDFLDFHTSSNEVPQIASSYSKFTHPEVASGYRVTSFPEQWGTAFNRAFYGKFLSITKGESINEDALKELMDRTFGENSRNSKKAARYWLNLYKKAQIDLNHGDALMSYAAISLGIKYKVPWTSLSRDIAHQDNRGMHKREKQAPLPPHFRKISSVNGERICLECELANSQIKYGMRTRVKKMLYSIKSLVESIFQ
jgi:hypothetical protein